MGKFATGAALAVVAVAALLVGAGALATVALVVAVVALVDACLLLTRAGTRPVLLVAAIPGVVLPLAVTLAPAEGWGRISLAFAASLLLGFALVLVFGRRRGVVAGLGSTVVASLVVGLGASSLVLLRALPEGFRWVLALLVLVAVADVAGPLVSLVRRRRRSDSGPDEPEELVLAVPFDAVLPGLLAVAATAAALGLLLDPPLTWTTAALLAVVALVAALGGSYLHRALSIEAGLPVGEPAAAFVRGSFFGLVDAVLLAAPAAYVVARSAVL